MYNLIIACTLMDYFVLLRTILSYYLVECKQTCQLLVLSPSHACPHQARDILPPSHLHFYIVYRTRSSSDTLHASNAKRDLNAPRACRQWSVNYSRRGKIVLSHSDSKIAQPLLLSPVSRVCSSGPRPLGDLLRRQVGRAYPLASACAVFPPSSCLRPVQERLPRTGRP